MLLEDFPLMLVLGASLKLRFGCQKIEMMSTDKETRLGVLVVFVTRARTFESKARYE